MEYKKLKNIFATQSLKNNIASPSDACGNAPLLPNVVKHKKLTAAMPLSKIWNSQHLEILI